MNMSVGKALRDAKNSYLPGDASWLLWWSPPLNIDTGDAWLDLQMAQDNYADLYQTTASKGLKSDDGGKIRQLPGVYPLW